ncbi:isoquinoline 1-oxidoreductase [Caulobacter sp. Root1455]|uniref:xanthine dehydrogenase family protein molybdopterin-binding subunit n=1 Tax=Caulobacter sp. Root1455 TaxID=1736465 RepID=UPI0006F3E416|nr:xanthine dehydrogenase family protein molybdopterin-binding subunit [Caulobacter sp. Root1455]KQZ05781.1 isoquinoline 1-oxidoreductase [Caulobacter sp. Root1455]
MNRLIQKLQRQEGVSRRDVVVGATLVGGALLVGCSPADLMSAGSKVEPGAFGPFIQFDPDGAVTVLSKHIEFGQGNHAGLAAIVAEELDADWSRIKVVHAPANAKLYGNTTAGIQLTGGSSAISNSWEQLRKAGAGARAMFVQAAATRWNLPVGQITVKDGVVGHASGKSAGFGELIAEAANVTPPENPTLKDPKTFTLIGTDRVRRKDSLIKSNGSARYTQDVQLPDMLVAVVAHAPRFGATVKSFDADDAKKVAGVVDVYEIPTGIAVVADTTYAARMGREALKIEWDEGKVETRGSATIAQQWRDIAAGKGPADLKWQAFDSKGDAAAASAGKGAGVFETTYDFPYLAHATMEPMNCVAIVSGNKVKLIHGSQAQTLDQMNAAKIVKTLPGSVEIETLFAGGSFGRRANFPSDYVAECVTIAQKVGQGRPVKLVWTREDDMRAGYYRPLVHHAVRVTLDKDGYPATWRHRIVTQSIMKGSPMPSKGPDQTAIEGTAGSPYLKATPIVDAQLALPEGGVPVLWWRSVGATHNAFVMEHTIDQLALKAGKDPVEYRRALYAKAGAQRHLAALNLAVEKAGPRPAAGFARGVAVHESFGSVVAQVAEVKLVGGEPRVGRVVTAIDCGVAVSPDQVAAQMEGGTCYGLSAALYGEITLTDGRVDQSNFDTYRVLRMNEAPTVETYIVPSGNPPSGVGEPGTPVIAPAVANALLALSKTPTSRLPFVRAEA